jgi:putative MATE family efflux protein
VQGVWLALALGGLLAGLGVAVGGSAIAAFGATGDVADNALVYLRISAFGAPAVLLALVGVGYLRGLQDTRTTLVVAVASNVINLVIEVVLIYGLDYGIGASAVATVIAQVCAALAYVVVVVTHVRRAGVGWKVDANRLRRLVVVGRDLFVRTGSLLAALAVATAVASRIGDVELAAHQVAFQLWSFLALVLDAIAIAGQAIIGKLLGAGDADGARASARRMIEWGIAAGIVFGVAVVVLRTALAPVFSDDARVTDLAAQVLVVVAVLQPINAIVFVLDGVLIGAGDLRYLAGAMLASSAIVFLPAAFAVLVTERGLLALWGALTLLMLARLLSNVVRFRSEHWQVVGHE